MKWRLTAKTFIEPELYQADTVIEYDGPISMSMQPVDEEAQVAWKKWADENPVKAFGGKPFDELEIVAPRARVTSAVVPEPKELDIENTTGVAMLKQTKGKPGLAQGGKAVEIK